MNKQKHTSHIGFDSETARIFGSNGEVSLNTAIDGLPSDDKIQLINNKLTYLP
jgi:hypothetical protein